MISNIITVAALASTAFAVAIPQDTPATVRAPTFGEPFSLNATGPGIDNVIVQARQKSLWLGGAGDAKCATAHAHDYATFGWYSDKRVYLWTNSQPTQGLYTDQSGMGQGVTQYFTGDNPTDLPADAKRSPYEIDATTRKFTFNGVGAKACPSGQDGVYTLWFTELEKPGNQDGCVSVELSATYTGDEVACEYSHA